MPSYRMVMFDYDGTLVSTAEAIAVALSSTLVRAGFGSPDEAAIRLAIGQPLDETIRQFCGDDLSPKLITQLVCDYREAYFQNERELVRPFPGATEVVTRLARRGLRVVIVTNKGERAVQRSLLRFGWASSVDLVVAESADEPLKPSEEAFTLRILPMLPDIGRNAIVMVGDSAIDMLFARRIGVRCCWARYGYGDPTECNRIGYEYVIDSLPELAVLSTYW